MSVGEPWPETCPNDPEKSFETASFFVGSARNKLPLTEEEDIVMIHTRNKLNTNPLDELLNGLDLCSSDPHSTYNPDQEDLGEWFSGAPSWIRRS